MKKLKKGFREIFLITMVLSLMTIACKQPQSNSPGTETITVTVQKDAHIKKAPSSFSLEKGSKLGFTELKKRMPELEVDLKYDISKITIGTSDGIEITDSAPHTFNEDVTIFISSRIQNLEIRPVLIELKVDGKEKDIEDVMDAGKTNKDKILIQAKANLADAKVETEPALEDGFWKLKDGMQSLKITVKRGSDKKEYEFKIEKVASDVPLLKKLTVGGKSKEGSEITNEMIFTVSKDATDVDVKAERTPEDAVISFDPPLDNGKLNLSGDETQLTITVGVAPKVSTYTVKVRKLLIPTDLIELVNIYGGRKAGVPVTATEDETERILGGEDVLLELAGPSVTLLMGARDKIWTNVKLNGKKVESYPFASYKSVCFEDIELLAKGEILPVKLEVRDNSGSTELNFRIKRSNETIDVPISALYIRGKDVITDENLPKLYRGPIPSFDGAEPCHIEVEVRENVMKSATIDGFVFDATQKTNAKNQDVWVSEGSVTDVQPSGKDVTLVVNPIDAETYNPVTWRFHLEYKPAESIGVVYEFNGKNKNALDNVFVQGLYNKVNPLLELETKSLNIKLAFDGKLENVKINEDVIPADQLRFEGEAYILTHSIPIDATEKQIKIEVNPFDLAVYSPTTIEFRVKGGTNIENILPEFEMISGEMNLPKATFLDKLSGTEKPLITVSGKTADIVIGISGYEYEFLCKEVKVNDEKVKIKVSKASNNSLLYQIKESIPINETSPADVKVEFIANEGRSENLTWQFRVQGGGKAPSLPQVAINVFTINEVGSQNNPLPKELTEHLIDGVEPVYTFDGTNALVNVGTSYGDIIEEVIFKLDGEQKHQMVPVKGKYVYLAEYTFEISDMAEHKVELIIKPKIEGYSDLVYTFKLKWSGTKSPLPVIFGIDGKLRPNGYKGIVASEKAVLIVQAAEEIMQEVRIGEKGFEELCTITTFRASDGKTYWRASKEVSVADANGNGVEKTFAIKVTPIDANEYKETVCEYILTGTKLPSNNAEFAFAENNAKVYTSNIEWMPGLENSKYVDDYGAKAVFLTAYTLSPRAKVKYQIVDMDGNTISGHNESEMTNANGKHTSARINLFADKPTKIKVWVVAEDGHTVDNERGVRSTVYNPVSLVWGYEDKASGEEYTTRAYDTIAINKNSVDATNKIHLVFVAWNESFGYTVVNEGLPVGQGKFTKLGAADKLSNYYKTEIDVTKLLDGSSQEFTATLKMKKDDTDCLTYNVKIVLAP